MWNNLRLLQTAHCPWENECTRSRLWGYLTERAASITIEEITVVALFAKLQFAISAEGAPAIQSADGAKFAIVRAEVTLFTAVSDPIAATREAAVASAEVRLVEIGLVGITLFSGIDDTVTALVDERQGKIHCASDRTARILCPIACSIVAFFHGILNTVAAMGKNTRFSAVIRRIGIERCIIALFPKIDDTIPAARNAFDGALAGASGFRYTVLETGIALFTGVNDIVAAARAQAIHPAICIGLRIGIVETGITLFGVIDCSIATVR